MDEISKNAPFENLAKLFGVVSIIFVSSTFNVFKIDADGFSIQCATSRSTNHGTK